MECRDIGDHPESADEHPPTVRIRAVTVPSFTLPDQGGRPWSLAEHLDAAVLIVTLRGDW